MVDERRLGSSYVLKQVLGSGASGQVWSGIDSAGHAWAFKLLRDDLAADRGIVDRFIQERSVLASIRHPNVVRVHDLVVEGQTLAIVMDLVEGRDLGAVLSQEGTLSPERVATLGAQIAAGLQEAHRGGIVHRDVKPGNVLIDASTGQARLTDFGIARLVDGSARSTMVLGTPQYMAPEIAEGKQPTPAVDLYSLGIMLYELCCGVPPFAGRGSSMATLRAHALDSPGRPDGIPDRLWALIIALTAKDPAKRPDAATAAAELSATASTVAEAVKAPRLTSPPPPNSSGDLIGGPGPEAATILGATATMPSGQTPFPESAGNARWAGPAAGGYPASGGPWQTPGYGPFPGHPGQPYPSGGYASGGYPSAPPQATKRSGGLVGAVIGAVLVATVGLGWVVLTRSSQTPGTAPVAVSASPSASSVSTSSAGRATDSATTSAPRTVTVTGAVSAAGPQEQGMPGPAIRQAQGDQLVRAYLNRAESQALSPGDMASFFTPVVNWYDKGSVPREQVWRKIQPDPSRPRTYFPDRQLQRFVPGVTHNGQPADRLEYLVRYSRRDMQGQETASGQVNVAYVVVGAESGTPRIAEVFEF